MTPPQHGLTIFIPVYNEEALLAPNTMELIRFLSDLNIPFEIIIGSNGSTDGTTSVASQLSASSSEVRWFHLPQKGVGTAFAEAVRRCAYDRIVTVDMDLSIALEFIERSYHLLDRCDIVIGSKITGCQQRSLLRRLASYVFIQLARRLLNIGFHDYSIAAKAYRKEVAAAYIGCVDRHTFYVVHMVFMAARDGKKLMEIPVSCIDLRESRFNLVHEGFYKFGNLFRLYFKEYPYLRK